MDQFWEPSRGRVLVEVANHPRGSRSRHQIDLYSVADQWPWAGLNPESAKCLKGLNWPRAGGRVCAAEWMQSVPTGAERG